MSASDQPVDETLDDASTPNSESIEGTAEQQEPEADTKPPGFEQFELHPSVLQALESLGYEQPTPIQQQAIPVLYEGHDLLGQAQTGTGKTAAFALPFLSLIDLKLAKPQVLVLAPTRELAIQVAEAFQSYAKFLKGFHVLPVYGGQHIGEQLRALKRGVHVIVGTPGRVIDHLNRKTLDFSELGAVVLDEADEMLRMGFIEDVETILEETPDDKQIALFSATMPRDIQRVADRFLQEPEHIKIETRTTTVETIRQRYIQVNAAHKLNALTRVLEVEKIDGAIIFSRTKTGTMELAEKLEARGYSCSALNGDMNQTMREKTVDQLKRGAIDVVCATDVAARGLDVERISHVINYDIPTDTEAYVHRIGRTGRAGRTGEAILFVTPRERHLLRAIERATRQTVEPMRLPSHEDLADKRVADFKARISSTIESEELEYFAEVVDSYSAEHDVEPREIAAALAYLMQKDRPLIPNEPEIPAGKSFDREQKRQQRDRRDDRGRREERGNSDRGNYERGSGERGYGDRDDRREKRRRPPEPGMKRYRIEVGREHGVQAKNVVGAIANEAGLDSRDIGQITFFDRFSTVDLPQGMPREIEKALQNVWVCSQQLKIREWHDEPPGRREGGYRGKRDDRDDRPRRHGGNHGNERHFDHRSDGDRPNRSPKNKPHGSKDGFRSGPKAGKKPHRKGPGAGGKPGAKRIKGTLSTKD